jgi:hypothetical protein
MRSKVTAAMLVALALTTVTGCARSGAHPRAAAASTPTPPRPPAADAGGACYLLEYEVVEQVVGTSFDVAAASQAGDTFVCVLQQAKSGSYPDLTLAVSPTDANPAVFTATVSPKGAAPVPDLGKIGYSASVPAAADTGPAVEVGWLSGNNRLLVLRYHCPRSATADDIGGLTPKLVVLARKIDQTSL